MRLRQGYSWIVRRPLLVVVILVVAFGLGDAVGSGRIYLSTQSQYGRVATALPEHLDYSSVNQVYAALRNDYDGQLTQTQVLDGLKAGLAQATHDPYTEFFTAAQAKDFQNQLNNSFSGIGAELGKDKSGNLIIVSPIAGFPAAKAGLKSQDVITSINGTSTAGMSIDTAVSKIRGPQGSKVTLQVVRNQSQALSFSIVRQNIQLPSVTTKMLPGNIGYITISSFADDTSSLIQQAAFKLSQAHPSGIVLDLRGNPGGLLDAAVTVSSEWLPEGKTILQEKRGQTVVQTYYSTGQHLLVGIPTVVLIDQGSASAAEITAGALHDNGAAKLVGVKSFGKGVVQQMVNFPDGSELKVTVASWYRPDGQNINKKGITPDQTVPVTAQDVTAGNDVQLKAALAYLAAHH